VDGGQNWEMVFTPNSGLEIGIIIDIEVVEPDIIFAISDLGDSYRSVDAGETWTQLVINTDNEINPNINQIQFFDAENGIVVVGYNLFGELYNGLYKTTDGGETWTLIYETSGYSLTGRNNLYFRNKENGFLCNNSGELEKTTNGGNSWTPISIANENEMFRNVFFPTEQTGYVSSYNEETKITRLYRSDDGGSNWELDFEKDSTFISGFHFSDSNNGYLYTSNKTVFRRSGTTNAKQYSFAEHFKIYPNPLGDVLLIENDFITGDYDFEITNAIGQIQHKGKLNTSTQQVSTKTWTSGFYFIQIRKEGGSLIWSEKIVKDKD